MATNTPEEDAFFASTLSGINVAHAIWSYTLVFFMQAGFTMLETGAVRVKNTKSILLKNLYSTALSGILFWTCGWAFTYGEAERANENHAYRFINWGNFFLRDEDLLSIVPSAFTFQFGFCAAAVTIVSGAMAERTVFLAYLCHVVITSAWTYPVIAQLDLDPDGWLNIGAGIFTNGFIDFAGSGVVHMTGGVTALVGIACVGVYILWFGWYGFNPGSSQGLHDGTSDTLAIISARVAANTTLAACTAGCTALLASTAWVGIFERKLDYTDPGSAMNGALIGLVAITSPCAVVETWAAVVIGAVGGVLYKLSSEGLIRARLDDPVDAIPVHLVGGILGCISAGLFAHDDYVAQVYGNDGSQYGLVYGGGGEQIGVQFLGVAVIFAFAGLMATAMFLPLRLVGWLRVEPSVEKKGMDSSGYGANSWARVEIMDGKSTEEFQFRIQ
eukprot:CAMPEP_0177637554 /NCGR_PEP_ID=MMETSP0447-20121125/5031_1 /TAXON_ID=0 /ORGANISM="Stygamoeba regulata, Strain BSH-02190019" /LENGTH=443 /DNA_ID=CAMNT_0019139485 /DNA_START=26 /DNA_END=1358 /DNA_ORIENTATION=+